MTVYITEHYSRTEEKPIAMLNNASDMQGFLTAKTKLDEEEGRKVLYRVYNDHELLHEINSNNITTSIAKYAEGNADFSTPPAFAFQVMINQNTIAEFNHEDDAYLYIACKLQEEDQLYSIYKDSTLRDTLTATILANRQKTTGSTDKGSNYKLSPLSTRPTPPGGPADYWVKDEDE